MSNKRMSSRYYYFTADDPYVRASKPERRTTGLDTYKFRQPEILLRPLKFKRDAVPIAFRASPESLLDMTVQIIQKWELPSVYTWSTEKVCQWIREYGYPQYQNTFRGNLINGRTLLLVDASALPAMNIKDFDHIRHITHGIRCLFYFEVTTFARSISLPSQNYIELYKMLRVKNGIKYESSHVVDLWRRMQLVPPPKCPKDHWDVLESSLAGHHDLAESRLIRIGCIKPKIPEVSGKRAGGTFEVQHRKFGSFTATEDCGKMEIANEVQHRKMCECFPPCECFWTEQHLRKPWNLDAVQNVSSQRKQRTNGVLSILTQVYPARYNPKSTISI